MKNVTSLKNLWEKSVLPTTNTRNKKYTSCLLHLTKIAYVELTTLHSSKNIVKRWQRIFSTSFRFCAILGNIASDILDNPFANFYPSMHYKLNDSDGLSSGECHLWATERTTLAFSMLQKKVGTHPFLRKKRRICPLIFWYRFAFPIGHCEKSWLVE